MSNQGSTPTLNTDAKHANLLKNEPFLMAAAQYRKYGCRITYQLGKKHIDLGRRSGDADPEAAI